MNNIINQLLKIPNKNKHDDKIDSLMNSKFFRDANTEERTSVDNYIKSISKTVIPLYKEEIDSVLELRDDNKYVTFKDGYKITVEKYVEEN